MCNLNLEELKTIPVKLRNTEEKKRYFQLMYQKRKAENVETEIEKSKRQTNDRIKMEQSRKNKTDKEKKKTQIKQEKQSRI